MRKKRIYVRTRNKSRAKFKTIQPLMADVILRLGSTTPTEDITRNKSYITINSVEACAISADKMEMKRRFIRSKIDTAKYFNLKDYTESKFDKLTNGKKAIIKRLNSSKGNGIYLIESKEDIIKFLKAHKAHLSNYIIERYYTYTREYRLHVTQEGYFSADRKMLLKTAKVRWHRHDSNSVWIKEDNPMFDKPICWDKLVDHSVRACKACGLDICAVDVKIQSNKKDDPKFIILETNSAPGLSDRTIDLYINEINKMII